MSDATVRSTTIDYDPECELAVIRWRGTITAQLVIDVYERLFDLPGCGLGTDRISDFTEARDLGELDRSAIEAVIEHFKAHRPDSYERPSLVANVAVDPMDRVWLEYWVEWMRQNSQRRAAIFTTFAEARQWIDQMRADAGSQ